MKTPPRPRLLLFFFLLLMITGRLCAVDRVVDRAELLTEGERAALQSRMDAAAAKYGFGLAVVTETSISGAPKDFADRFFDDNGIGVGDSRDGALLLQVTSSRDWYISTSGTGLTVFSGYGLDRTGSRIVEHLRDGDVYAAYTAFLDDAERYLALAAKGRPFTFYRAWLPLFIVIAWALSFGVALAVVLVWKSGMNNALPGVSADSYVVPGSLAFSEKSDTFLYNIINRSERSQESSGGSGGGGGGGGSHGGRGGKY